MVRMATAARYGNIPVIVQEAPGTEGD